MLKIVIVAAAMCLVSCGAYKAEDSSDKASQEPGPATKSASSNAADSGKAKNFDPCSLLSEDKLRELAEIDAEQPVEIGADKFLKTVCTYKWDKLRTDGSKMLARVGVSVPGRAPETVEAATAKFKKALESTAKSMGGSYEAVEGIGDEAAWNGSLRQVAVRQGKNIAFFDVNAFTEKPANRAFAEEIAKAIFQ